MASVTTTYAHAFADAIFDLRLDPAKTLHEAKALAHLVGESKELREVWETPSITPEQKRAVLDAIAARENISRAVRNFVAVLIDHRRTKFLHDIVKQLELELDQRLGFAEAEIATARDLSDPERRALEAQIRRLTGKKVRARYSRDSSLLGGAVVRLGSTIYDGSVSGQLERIREQLSGT
ncbi:MAG TPA: ATP synthase F1 subunit delta [Terriglobales bacterium]|nr:ATP synthase F1 subunit delta [Terriglobales bacterium]